VVPFGAHPQGMAGRLLGLDDGYGEDYDFIMDYQNAARSRDKLEEWLEMWVHDCPTQERYLDQLGSQRLTALMAKSKEDTPVPAASAEVEANATEKMVVIAAREIKRRVLGCGFETILTGIGAPALAAWLAFYLLKAEGKRVDLCAGTGLMGYEPRPGDPFLMTPANLNTCRAMTDTVEMYSTFVGGARSKCLAVLGAAQIDKHGNINTTKIDGQFFIGPGGAGDAINGQETLVVAAQSAKRLMEQVPFVTCPGDSVRTLVTNLGVFQKTGRVPTLSLVRYLEGKPADDRVKEIKENTSWPVEVAAELSKIEGPTAQELAILRALDPQGSFIRK
jgi:acyl CoA:acetate/3-ketoacid CoA transferase beta subunit